MRRGSLYGAIGDTQYDQGSARLTMKRNTFYLLIGVTGMLLVALLWASIGLAMPILIQGAFLIGLLLVYAARRTVTETIDDERTNVITQNAAVATLSVFWVVFFLVSISSPLSGSSAGPSESCRPILPDTCRRRHPSSEGISDCSSLGLLGLMIILYGGFRIYYARKFGDWESDEE